MITTAVVEVKALTISGKQVTQSVFKQLPEERLYAPDGTMRGRPWGRVNFHPGRCTPPPDTTVWWAWPEHAHVVWQLGDELRRATVWAGKFDPDVSLEGRPWISETAPPSEWNLVADLPQLFIAV
ncbi:hypothetical protein ACPCBX_13645 [Streptomyces tuirus]|uniref:hypothetical protein n=1 Tax=Streptomyces tuirus TaxID=68278 RepID=UPI0016898F84|nr:hypothetical protein [Streptomyces tuirus]